MLLHSAEMHFLPLSSLDITFRRHNHHFRLRITGSLAMLLHPAEMHFLPLSSLDNSLRRKTYTS